MKIDFVRIVSGWGEVLDAARSTVGKGPATKAPSAAWKKWILLAEHSPIRGLIVAWQWSDLPYWVSVHLVRHKIGIEHFVQSQRSDRTGVARDKLPQDAPVTHRCTANAQAIISISRKRLCHKASVETREAWATFVAALAETEPELAAVCVPECIYRGFCPELSHTCGYAAGSEYYRRLEAYRHE